MLLFTLIIMLVLSVADSYYNWHKKCQELLLLQDRITLFFINSIENSVWSLDENATSHLVDGILGLKEVASVVIINNAGDIFIEKTKHLPTKPSVIESLFFRDYYHFSYLLYRPSNTEGTPTDQNIGQLNVNLDHQVIWHDFIAQIYYSILILLVLVISLFLILERSFYFLLTRPLEQLSKNVSETNINDSEPYLFPVHHIHSTDELGILTNKINTTLSRVFAMKKELYQRATIDQVTGLSNRSRLHSVIKNFEFEKLPKNANYTIVLIDLDNFKSVNELLGHDVGDDVLKIIGTRLKNGVGKLGCLFRLGGDEFVIIYKANISEQKVNKNILFLLENIPEEILVKKNICKFTMSIGISYMPRLTTHNQTVLKQCDIAMYESKKLGGNTYQVYEPFMEDSIKSYAEISELIHWALKHSKLQASYQVKVCAKTKKTIGYELLVRILDAQNKLVPPDKFIAVAEKTRQIIEIGRWVLEEGIKRFHNDFQARGIQSIAINVSLVQLLHDVNFTDYACSLLDQYNIPADVIELEITENFLIENSDLILTKLASLQSHGFSIALDDFGTGYSSLSCIQNLPINTLKIDRSFVSKLPSQYAIPLTIIALAKNLKLSIVAEGVETIEQSEWLERESCTSLQGYLYGKPVPFEQLNMKDNVDINK